MAVPLRRRYDDIEIETFPRDEFVNERFDYKSGEHVTIAGPTQRGKTYLGLQLLQANVSPAMKGVVLASKPRDDTFRNIERDKRWKVTHEWPPETDWVWERNKRVGYVLRPDQHLQDMREDNANVAHHFSKAMMDSYGTTEKRILFIDEAHQVVNDYKLGTETEGVLKRGSALDCGAWCLIQRTRRVPYDMYNAPEHIFLFNDPDKTNRERFGEIGGGVDPRLVEHITGNLGQYQVLYIKRTGETGPLLCIVDP